MKLRVAIELIVLSVALIACAWGARRSKKPISNAVFLLLIGLLPPMIGNLLIILSGDYLVSLVGSYIYFIGMDFTVVALMLFSVEYCSTESKSANWLKIIYGFVIIDIVQLVANTFTGHAFSLVPIIVEDAPYYALDPHLGQTFHRVVAYGIFFASLAIFAYKTRTAPRIYMERYLVVLLVMVFTGAWETFYIFSGTPIDRSMIGFGVFGLLIYYFSLHYKPYRLLDRMLAGVVSSLDESVLFYDIEGKCFYANAAAREKFNVKSDADLSGIRQKLIDMFGREINTDDGEWCSRFTSREDGQKRYYELESRISREEGASQTVTGTYLIMRDVTESENKLIRERMLATRDRLTAVYNKDYFYDRCLVEYMGNPLSRYQAVAVDIKEFKIINDIYSKDFGDKVLCTLADVICECAEPGDLYGRLTGDKFGLFVKNGSQAIESLRTRLRSPLLRDEEINYPIVVHVGVYEVERDNAPVSVMFDRAFMAISSIKKDYQHHVAYYDNTMREKLIWAQTISSQLNDAMQTGQIRPYLQPLVNSEGEVEGAEVLVRWIHPEEGFLSPARFIPIFEENGMIATLDKYMWECACKLLKDWSDRGIDLFLSVNISPKDFFFIDVEGTLHELVERYGIDPRKLRLEITETVMMSDLENRLRIIEELRSSGFLVEMDDFGSGYSSLNMLKDIPVDVLKIDMMFLYQTRDQSKAQTILKMIIDLTQRLGIPSITEGVETGEQLEMLLEMGCKLFQGFYFAKPMPVEEFEERIQAA